jgi:hypothetical protein
MAAIDQLVEKLLGHAWVNQDLEVLTGLGENILRVRVVRLLRRGTRLLRHVVLLEIEMLLRAAGLTWVSLILVLSRVHGLRSHGGKIGNSRWIKMSKAMIFEFRQLVLKFGLDITRLLKRMWLKSMGDELIDNTG